MDALQLTQCKSTTLRNVHLLEQYNILYASLTGVDSIELLIQKKNYKL